MKLAFVKNKNFKAFFVSLFASVLGIVFNFLLARFLQAEEYGEVQLVLSTANTISIFAITGLSTFIIKEAKNPANEKTIFSKCVSFYLLTSIFVFPLAFFCVGFVSGISNLVFVIALGLFMGLDLLVSSFYQGNQKLDIAVLFETIIPKGILLVLLLVSKSIHQEALFGKYYVFASLFIYISLCFIALIKNFKRFDCEFQSGEIYSIFFFFGTTLTYALTSNVSKVIEGGIYSNNIALGIMAASSSIIALVNIFTNVMNNIAKPIFSRLARENKQDELLDSYRAVTRINSYIGIPFYIFFITQGEKFLFFFGESYLGYPRIMLFLALASMVSCLTGPNGTLLSMTGKEKMELFNGILHLSSFAAFAFAFSFNKVYGLCIALFLSETITNIAKYIEIWVIYKKNPINLKTFLTMIIAFAIDFVLIYFVRYIQNCFAWLAVGVLAGICSLAFNFFVLKQGRKDFKNFLRME